MQRLLQGDMTDVIHLPSTAGTLAFFRGRHSIHRVTPIVGDRLRTNAVLSFADKPDHRLNDAHAGAVLWAHRLSGVSHWFADLAWLGEVAERVTIGVADGRIASLTADSTPPPDATHLRGITIPGLANAHSHALHRALRARTQTGAADFWAWRGLMYDLVDRLDPDRYYALARATYAEMALAGITAVGEFHYLHHDRGGRRYQNPNAMGEALCAAAADAGLRMTLIDTCYLQAGVGGDALEGAQLRFSDGDAEAWAERVDALRESPTARIAAAIHSVRAVDPASMHTVGDWARRRNAPLHVHLSEQTRENAECIARHGDDPDRAAGAGGRTGPEHHGGARDASDPSRHRDAWDRPGPRSACVPPPSATSATASARPTPWPPPAHR